MPSWSAEKRIITTICKVENNHYICAEKGQICHENTAFCCYFVTQEICNSAKCDILGSYKNRLFSFGERYTPY